jgi:hypothetical protein
VASGTARAKSSYHPVVARAQRANRMCGNLDFASAASDPRDSECIVGQPEGIRVPRRGSVLRSVQLAFARQDAKERGESDDAGRRSDDSYSPRRHWCSMFKPDGEAWVRGLRTDV